MFEQFEIIVVHFNKLPFYTKLRDIKIKTLFFQKDGVILKHYLTVIAIKDNYILVQKYN